MTLKVGDRAPDFTLQSQHGEPVTLSGFAGKRRVIIVFYPFAFSRVCTAELGEIRDNLSDLADDATALLAISCDHMFSLRAFAEQDRLDFPLLSDFWPHGAVSAAYGVFDEQLGSSGRATFIVDRDGFVRWQVENDIPRARSLADVRKILSDLA